MTKRDKTIQRLLSGVADASFPFEDLKGILTAFGFSERIKGDHFIYFRDGVEEIINIQPKGNLAKPYQVKQVRGIVLKYRLTDENT